MSEINRRYHRPDADYDLDPSGTLCYLEHYTKAARLLYPGMPIEDPHLVIGKIGQQNPLPGHFSIRPKDNEMTAVIDEYGNVTAEPVPPGISTFLFWGTKYCNQEDLVQIAQSHLGRPPSPKNRIYIAQVRDIREAGWVPYFVPLICKHFPTRNPLHVLLVPGTIANGSGADASELEKVVISNVFIKW